MIYQPRNVQPSGVSIDGLLDNTFTMEIQTNSYVSAYQLLIVDFDNNEIYTSSKTTLTNYAYNGDILEIPVSASAVALSNGTNYKWRVRLYQPTADMLITYGLVQATSTTTTIYLQPNINIKAGMAITINSQTKTISSYNSDTGVAVVSSAFSSSPAVGTQYKICSDFIETVPDYIVYARRTPAVAISNVPSSLTLKYHTFQGTYTQSDNVPIVYHKFDLYTKNDDGTISLVASSDKVYSANLSYTYDSFRTGNKYLIQMTVENDMGVITTTDMYEFNVSYDIVEYLQQPLASFDDKNNAVKVSWVTPVENEATSFRSDAAIGIIQDNNNTLTQATFEPGQSIGEGDVVQITNSDCELVIDGKSTQATRSGKNLFNKSITPIIASNGQTFTELDTGVKISYTNSSSSNVVKYAAYKLIDLTNYVGKVVRIKCDFSKSNEILAPRYCIGLCDVNGNNRTQESVSITSGETISFTVPTLDGTSIYLCVWLYCTYTSPIEKGDYVDFTDIIITMDNEDMTYEPYKSVSSLFVLDQPLRSLPNGVKDIAYIKNNILYVDRKVGTVVLDGSESWQVTSRSNGYQFQTRNSLGKIIPATEIGMLSNYFKGIKFSDRDSINESIYAYNADTDIRILTNVASTTANFKTWLSTHNTQVDYELAEPYTETIGEVETLSTFKGVNNVSLVANMQTNMTITYPTEYEELDKHFLKDVNVSFSKKYGAVNSVVFSRGNGSDNIYRKDNASINKNGLTEIKIADNPFLEGDDRENFIQSLFDKINGLEFYIMDVASTGIMYLELGDFYYFNMVEEKPSLKSGLVKSGMRKAQGSSGGKFLCLLMNDEIKITQGLEESIYSDEPDITETDYKTASITDTSIKNAIIQTNKNSAEILLKVNSDEVVSAINLSPEKIKISSAKLDIDAIATFTNSKLAEAGSTVINGENITTGTLSANRISGGTISASTIDLKGTVLTPTSSSIGGLNVESGIISNDRMGLDTVNGVVKVFNANGGSMILSNAARLSATAGIGLTSNSNGNVSAPSVNLDLKACSGAKVYLGSMINADGTDERSGITCSNGVLSFRSTGYCTYNGTTVFGSSSKATKENIEDLSQEQKEEVYELIKNIPTKQYDYKKEYGKPFNYGFVIEDIENTKLKELLHITQAENNKDIKMYSTEDLVRLQLIVIQELMRKVENLEKKESENNAKD